MKTSPKGTKSTLTHDTEWAQHLRSWGKKLFWGQERSATRKFLKKEIEEN